MNLKLVATLDNNNHGTLRDKQRVKSTLVAFSSIKPSPEQIKVSRMKHYSLKHCLLFIPEYVELNTFLFL